MYTPQKEAAMIQGLERPVQTSVAAKKASGKSAPILVLVSNISKLTKGSPVPIRVLAQELILVSRQSARTPAGDKS